MENTDDKGNEAVTLAVHTLSIQDVVSFAKVTVGSDKGEDRLCRIPFLPVIWSVSMIQILGAQEVKYVVGLPDCAKIAVNEDDVIYIAWYCSNI